MRYRITFKGSDGVHTTEVQGDKWAMVLHSTYSDYWRAWVHSWDVLKNGSLVKAGFETLNFAKAFVGEQAI